MFTRRPMGLLLWMAILCSVYCCSGVGGAQTQSKGKTQGVEIGKPLMVVSATAAFGPWAKKQPFAAFEAILASLEKPAGTEDGIYLRSMNASEPKFRTQ